MQADLGWGVSRQGIELCGEGAESDSVNPAGHLGNAGLQLGVGRLVGMWAELGVG